MEMNNTCRVCKQILLIQVLKVQNYLGTIYIYIYIYIYIFDQLEQYIWFEMKYTYVNTNIW